MRWAPISFELICASHFATRNVLLRIFDWDVKIRVRAVTMDKNIIPLFYYGYSESFV